VFFWYNWVITLLREGCDSFSNIHIHIIIVNIVIIISAQDFAITVSVYFQPHVPMSLKERIVQISMFAQLSREFNDDTVSQLRALGPLGLRIND
jgi:hypothetical protein